MGMAPRKANFVGRCTLLDESVTFIYYCMLYLIWFLFSLRNMPLFDVARTSLAKKEKIVQLNCIGRAAVRNASGVRSCLLLCSFFWMISRRLSFMCRRFGTLCLFHLRRWCKPHLWRWNRVFRNVGSWNL